MGCINPLIIWMVGCLLLCMCDPDIVGDSVAERTVRHVRYLMFFVATVFHV